MKKFINYGKQSIQGVDKKQVLKTLSSEFLTTGPEVKKFEKKFSNYVKAKYSISCSNGTVALYLAFRAIGLKKNDIIIIPSINFIAAANMASLLRANIYLADVDPLTGQMTPETLKRCIEKNKLKKIKAICTMYNGGNPLHAKEFFLISRKKKSYLIEDACHALGGKYLRNNEIKVGSCKYSDISTFSFHPVKPITSGEGGMISTNSNAIKKKIMLLRNHGIVKKSNLYKNNWSYDVVDHGFNFRLSDIHASLGSSQLKYLNFFIKKRNNIAKAYNMFLKKNKFINIKNNFFFNTYSGWHLYVAHINFKKLKITKEKLIQALYKKKIIVQVHYIPTFLFKKFKKLKRSENFIGANQYFNSALSLPIYPDLKLREVKKIIFILNKILNDNAK